MPQRSPQRRGLWATGFLCAGNTFAHEGVAIGSVWTCTAAFLLAIAGAVLRGRLQMIVLAAAVVLLGHGLYTIRVLELSHDSIGWQLRGEQTLLEVEGTIATPPRVQSPQRGQLAPFAWYEKPVTRFELRVDTWIDGQGHRAPASEKLWIRIGEAAERLRVGDRIRIMGLSSALEGPTNPGERDIRPTAMQRGIVGRLSADSLGTVTQLPATGLFNQVHAGWLRLLANTRNAARVWIEAGAEDDPTKALLVGLLLGERNDAMRDLSGAFSRTGLAHVLSVSGFHLVAFVMTLVFVIRLHGEHPFLEPWIVGICVVAYVMLMPAQAPIIRAAAMTLGLLAAESFGRRYDRLNTLALVLGGVVLWRPMELWDIGCQLSFVSVAALIIFAMPLRVRLFGERPNRDELALVPLLFEMFKDAVAASIAAWAFTAPLVTYHLGVVSPLAPIATLITLPLAIGVVGAGYAAVVMGLVAPWAAGPAHWLIDTGARWLAEMVLWIDAWPGSVVFIRGHGASTAWTLGAMLIIGWWMTRASPRRWTDLAATILLIGWTAVRFTTPPLRSDVVARVDMLDVGDGSCHLIRSGREAVMYDCGSTWYAVGERVIPMALRALHSPKVTTLIISHPDIDHFAGVLDVLRPLGVREVIIGEAFERQATDQPDGPAAYVLEGIRKAGVLVRVVSAGDIVRVGELEMNILAPSRGKRFKHDNDGSLVVRTRIQTTGGERTILLCGDIEDDAITSLKRMKTLDADILEAPHHGSARPEAIKWVGDLDPAVVLQSTGPSRRHDPRWDAVRESRTWHSTAESGAAWVEITRDGDLRSGHCIASP